jgi:hypothetical protein
VSLDQHYYHKSLGKKIIIIMMLTFKKTYNDILSTKIKKY